MRVDTRASRPRSSQHATVPAVRIARAAASSSTPGWLATRQAPPRTCQEALARLEQLADRLAAKGDRRAVFAGTYAIQVRAFAQDMRLPGRYENPAWIERMTLDFVQRYFDAFEAYERGDLAAVPQAWRLAFDRAVGGKGPVVGDLLLAMNAHINHDLPLTLAATGANARVRADYFRFNQVLFANIDNVQDLLEKRFLRPDGGRSLAGLADQGLGRMDEWMVGQTIRRWRQAAWEQAGRLTTAGPAAYPAVTKRADGWARAIAGAMRLVPGVLIKRRLI